MKAISRILFLVLVSSLSFAQVTPKNDYVFKQGDPNGIGKWYKGREIASVMGFEGMEWLERPEREAEENVSLLLNNMKIKDTDVIADIGAGSGYHVFRIAPRVPNGKVLAVDIQEEMLETIYNRKNKGKIKNIELILGSEKSVNIPENTVDKVLLVDVYHEFSFPYEMMHSIKKALRPEGQIFLIEYRAEDIFVPIKEVHKMSERQAVKEMKAVGFKFKKNISNLPWQHCLVFEKKK